MKSWKRLSEVARFALAMMLAVLMTLDSRPAWAAGTVSTLAGTGAAGFANGPGNVAQFNFPYDVAVDSLGNAYVPDYANHLVRKITPAGLVSTFAGTGVQGYADGPTATAKFNYPNSVAVDGSNNVYVYDVSGQRLRKITQSGIVSTLHSWTTLFLPQGLAADLAGNVFIADTFGNRIWKVTPAGAVSVLAGSGAAGWLDGPAATAKFRDPQGVAVDSTGNVYVGDTSNNRIRKITPAGLVSTLAGSGVPGFLDGSGAAAQFYAPDGVAVDSSGNVYVADHSNNRIRKITAAGSVTTFAGTGVAGFADGPALTVAKFASAPGVAVDGTGIVYVADTSNNRIRKIVDSTPPVLPCVAPPNTTMIAWYPFDETGGTTAANLATGNTGTHFGAPTVIPGKVGNALRFDGVDDFVESPSSIVTNIGPAGLPANCSGLYSTCRGDFSIDAWVRMPASSSNLIMPLVEKKVASGSTWIGYGFWIAIGRLGLQMADAGAGTGTTTYTSVPIPTLYNNQWHHVAVTVSRRGNPAGISWYLDGVVISTSNPTTPPTRYGSLVNSAPLRIGSTIPPTTPGWLWFKGDVDELEIFNRELTQAEVKSIFAAGTAGKCK